MKKFIITLLFIFLSLSTCIAGDDSLILPSQTGEVLNVIYVDINPDSDYTQTKQTADIKLLNGKLKGSIVTVDNMLTGNPNYDIKLKKGLKVILHVEQDENGLNFSVEDIKRSNVLIILSLIFFTLLLYVGRKKGLFSLISILITCIAIFWGLSPMILAGINPIIATLTICLFSTAATMYLVGGFNKKSTSAVIGCVLSLICAGLLSFLVVKTASLNGFNGENSMFLYAAHPELNFISIIISAMMLATLGAVMDVGMSIASTINEIYAVDNSKTIKELFISGMNVGRDIIGTMANTLILVYIGGSLPLILLATNIDLQKFFNLNQVVTEIASALIGSSAIVICVPITAIVASELITRINNNDNFRNLID